MAFKCGVFLNHNVISVTYDKFFTYIWYSSDLVQNSTIAPLYYSCIWSGEIGWKIVLIQPYHLQLLLVCALWPNSSDDSVLSWHREAFVSKCASSANTRNSSKALCRSIHVYFLHMTKKLEYFEKKMLTNFLENYVLHCFANLENFATL